MRWKHSPAAIPAGPCVRFSLTRAKRIPAKITGTILRWMTSAAMRVRFAITATYAGGFCSMTSPEQRTVRVWPASQYDMDHRTRRIHPLQIVLDESGRCGEHARSYSRFPDEPGQERVGRFL